MTQEFVQIDIYLDFNILIYTNGITLIYQVFRWQSG